MNYRHQIEFVSLLAQATASGQLHWEREDQYEDSYWSKIRDRRYVIHWIYWYDQRGITIDRQCVQISSEAISCSFAWGTEGMDHVLRLLGASDRSWNEHIQRIMTTASAQSLCKTGVLTMPEPVDLLDSWLSAVSSLLRATRAGKLRWERGERAAGDPEIYTAHFCGHQYLHNYVVEMLEPVTGEDEPFGGPVARISLPGVSLCFASGTEGMSLVQEMLSLSLPDWAARIKVERDALETECRFLQSLL